MRGARPLERREVRSLLAACKGPYAVRNRCMVRLGLQTGLRVSSLTSLSVTQVWSRGRPRSYLRLPADSTKTGRSQTLPLNNTAHSTIQELMRWKRSQGEPTDPSAPLFRSRQGRPLSRCQAHRILADAAERAGLDEGISSHSWRKAFASRMMDAGVPMKVMQQLLGHTALTTTERYLAVTQRSMRAAVRAVE